MNIREFLEKHNIQCHGSEHRHGRSGWINIDCPFCDELDSAHLGISETYPYANCWVCGKHRLWEVLHKLGLSTTAKKEFSTDVKFKSTTTQNKPNNKLRLPGGIRELSNDESRLGYQYLTNRGFNVETLANLWDIKFVGLLGSNYSWSVFIPIHYQGRIISWSTRSISDKTKLRYNNAPATMESMPAKDLLYGEDYVRNSVIVHEGFTDVWRTGPGSVATMGTSYTPAQVNRIAQYRTRIICFDNSKEAQRRASQLCRELCSLDNHSITLQIQLESGSDPADANETEINELREQFLI